MLPTTPSLLLQNARIGKLLTTPLSRGGKGMVACANDHGRFLSGNGANEVYVSKKFAPKCM
jgi:hypothetical protein